ncbi:MAG: hypothetical protein E7162_00540 [Firmicutes bacterium]|nr:hypothetical protein [Bacillota bacterium]
MKQELKDLKELTSKFIEVRDDFEKKKEAFDLCALFANSVDAPFLELEEVEVETPYDLANIFYEKFGFVVSYATALKEEHPRYGEKRFKNTLIETVISSQGWDYEEDYDKANYVVETHLAYDALGYAEVNALENELVEVAEKINTTTGAVAEQTVNAVKGAGRAVANVFRPYGEVAKGQLEVAGRKAKGAVNKGAKQLIKALESLADKTEGNK